jgi:hypothetical protein
VGGATTTGKPSHQRRARDGTGGQAGTDDAARTGDTTDGRSGTAGRNRSNGFVETFLVLLVLPEVCEKSLRPLSPPACAGKVEPFAVGGSWRVCEQWAGSPHERRAKRAGDSGSGQWRSFDFWGGRRLDAPCAVWAVQSVKPLADTCSVLAAHPNYAPRNNGPE